MPRSVVWFKRDLRVADHAPLVEAAGRGPVVGLYVHEPEVLASPEWSPGHLAFIEDCLGELRRRLASLGSVLLVRHGAMPETLDRLHDQWRFEEIWSHEETGLAITYARDRRVAAWCRRRDVLWNQRPQHGVIRPLASRDGWAGRWRRRMSPPPLPVPKSIEGPTTDAIDLLAADDARSIEIRDAGSNPMVEAQRGGEHRATGVLESFLHDRGEDYQRAMSTPVEGWTACSRLSPHLAYGSLSIRTVHHATRHRIDSLREDPAAGRWRRSLASYEKRLRWHCHFMQKLEDEPEIEFRNFNRAFDDLREEDRSRWSDEERGRFDAWVGGRTGYPLVDACMRCLDRTGWINFRMRAMLVSFAAYHLWLHWKPVAEHLATRFLDFEAGIHYSQCQMQSGVTGINTVRIYSPIKQAIDQDPEGRFIRRWVPELADVPDEHIARPEGMPPLTQHMSGCVIGDTYPAPVVDHETAYRTAKERIFDARGTSLAKREASRVYRKHGSRSRRTERR
ncbi:MAG: deoxyribodipyrimidine photolyase [Planctomycetaceae bacterium]|nr:deoxyribodipyrimidine photolyase [Planctomycetaceae bacterium]